VYNIKNKHLQKGKRITTLMNRALLAFVLAAVTNKSGHTSQSVASPSEEFKFEESESQAGEETSRKATQGQKTDLLRRYLEFDLEHTNEFKFEYFTPEIVQELTSTEYEIFWKNATTLKAQKNKKELFIQFLESIIREADEFDEATEEYRQYTIPS
jgi:hypothetical protein